MSDLHLSPGSEHLPPLVESAKLVVVAGDTCEGLVKAVDVLRAAYPDVDIAMVAGNHEFYGHVFNEELEAGRERARERGVHLLENDTAIFGRRLRVIGATLWTDYLLFGPHLQQPAMRAAYDQMRDHKRIRWNRDPWQRFRPQEALSLHVRSRNFFETELARPHDGPTMLLAHHGMTWEALDPAHERSLLAAAFASEVPFATKVDIVVTGHTHRPMDFRRGHTRFISNPRGYPGEGVRFDHSFIIEVPDAD